MVLKFDLSPIPAGVTIKDAKVSVYMCGPMYEGTNGPKSVYRVTKDWTESTVTFDAPWTTKGGDYAKPALAKSSNTSHDTWEDYNVTETVRGMYEKKMENFGFLFKFDTLIPKRGSCIYSSEHSKTTLRPKLTITYGDSTTAVIPIQCMRPDITGAGDVTVYNILGRTIASFRAQNADRLHEIRAGLSSGAHIASIRTPDTRNRKKVWVVP